MQRTGNLTVTPSDDRLIYLGQCPDCGAFLYEGQDGYIDEGGDEDCDHINWEDEL